MALLVLAYPDISKADYECIQAFRRQNDVLYYNVVEPHFTLVFPVFDWKDQDFIAEVTRQLDGLCAFDFSIRGAALNKDAFNDFYHAFLVPDEGYSTIVRVHDRLYAEKLFSNRVLTVDFVPHIGIGNATDPQACLKMVRHWNAQEFSIPGRISSVDIARYAEDCVETLERISLD
jgi:hypothetical protein